MNNKPLTTQQVADMLGVPKSTIEHWRLNRIKLPFYKVGKHVRYLPEDVEAYFQSTRNIAYRNGEVIN